MIQTRDDLDLDWDAVYEAAAATGTALEMNGSPHRLDLAAERARRAHESGCVLSIDSDAHRTEELGYVRWGVDQARRAWVEPRHVLNTLPLDELLAWVAGEAVARLTRPDDLRARRRTIRRDAHQPGLRHRAPRARARRRRCSWRSRGSSSPPTRS